MAKYKFCSMNIPHGVAVQMNSKNNKKRLFSVAGKSGLSSYMPISKEYLDISHIANDQEHSPYVMFVCSDKKDKTIVTNDFQTFKMRNWKKKVKLCTDREHDKALVENFSKFETKHTTQIFEQSDGLIMFVNPYFGEVLYDTISCYNAR